MDSGTYTAASGGVYQLQKLDVVNNNLANINTPGFKRQFLVGEEQSFEKTLAAVTASRDPYAKGDHDRSSGVTEIETATDFAPGPIKNTSNPLDVALLKPNDFFVINTAEGERYTRAGNFTLNAEGELSTVDGAQVAGDGGAIVANGVGVGISGDGSVRVNGTVVGKIRVVRFEDPKPLQHVGNSRFALGAGQAPPAQVDAEVEPQALEMSNVSAITTMIDLISANRAFEAYGKSARTIDEMNNQAISSVGRRR